MATRNLVPRSGSEGSVGTNSKPWGSMIANIGHFNSIISASGDIVAFGDISSSISSTGSFGKLEIAGNSNFTGDVTIGGNINIGDADTDSLVISADLSSSLIPNDDSTYDLGTGAKNWRRGYVEKLEVTNITASGNIDFNGDLDVDGTTDLDATNVSLTLDVDGATTLDQVTINTTDGEFKVEGGNQVNIDSNIDIDNATTAIDTTTSTIITSPIINLVGPVTASGNISGSVTSTGSFGRIKFAGNLSGSYHSTASFGRLEVNANTISIGGTEIKKSVADNITTLDTPLSTTSEPQFAGLKLTSTASISEFTGSSFNFNATNAANLLSVYDESNALVMKVGKGLMVLGAQATAPAPEAGGFFYSGSGNPGEDDFYLGFE